METHVPRDDLLLVLKQLVESRIVQRVLKAGVGGLAGTAKAARASDAQVLTSWVEFLACTEFPA